MGVGDRHCERIGGVGAGDGDAGQQPLDHGVNLRFFSGAGADDRFLDKARSIFADFDPGGVKATLAIIAAWAAMSLGWR